MANLRVISTLQKHTRILRDRRYFSSKKREAQNFKDVVDTVRTSTADKPLSASSASSSPKFTAFDSVFPREQESPGSDDKNESSLPNIDLSSSLPSSDSSRQTLTPSFDARRVDPTTIKQVFYFDTLWLAKRLERNGFTRLEAEGLVEGLVDIVNATLDHQSRHMVTKSQQEIVVQQMMAEISSVKKEMVLLQKNEFSSLRNETEKQSIEIKHLQSLLNDEISKLKSQMKLDINLERGRAIEAHADSERQIQRIHNKIDTDIANLRTTFEIYRNDVFKYAAGTVLTCSTICLGIIRLWS